MQDRVREAVRKILAAFVVAHVDERQHSDGLANFLIRGRRLRRLFNHRLGDRLRNSRARPFGEYILVYCKIGQRNDENSCDGFVELASCDVSYRLRAINFRLSLDALWCDFVRP